VDDHDGSTTPRLTIVGVPADHTAGFALKAAVRRLSGRGGVTAANDAQALCALFIAGADQRLGGLS